MSELNCQKGNSWSRNPRPITSNLSGSLRTGKMTIEKKKITWVWLLEIAVVMILVAILLSSCGEAALATELTASYYTTEGLIKDGQWRITHGIMANGKRFRDDAYTCASCDYRLGDRLLISRGDKSVVVTVTDRTNRRFKGKRIDLTPAVFKMLSPSGKLKEGLIRVSVEKI